MKWFLLLLLVLVSLAFTYLFIPFLLMKVLALFGVVISFGWSIAIVFLVGVLARMLRL